jgi:WD40 repeat protein
VASAAFSADGTRIVTVSFDQARIWDVASGNEIKVLRGHQGGSATFSPDGTRIVAPSSDHTARIWDVHFATMSKKTLVVEACARRLSGFSILSREEMRLAGYSEATSEKDVCAGIE